MPLAMHFTLNRFAALSLSAFHSCSFLLSLFTICISLCISHNLFSVSLLPHQLISLCIAEISPQIQSKKQRKMSTVSAMPEAFEKYTDYLNQLNEKRERVVKASRDVTMNSKKVIFQVHRISKHNKDEVLEKAAKDLEAVTDEYMLRLVRELHGSDFWKLRRAYSPAVQEYVEAATLCEFCKTGNLLKLAEINRSLLRLSDPSLEPLQINILDYLLGVGDLTGELMRLAIGRISDGELAYAERICTFVRDIYRKLTLVAPLMDDNSEMKKKMETMLQSVMKIENACFSVHVRGSEFIPILGSSDPNFSFLGVSDMDL
ncbi:translin-associated protein X isoform X2 [Amborella trichopoda]|uniref:translin-associated protein X isoform X2 n=1 Tax=Amborella trichopoda TaxID=13333 RepID=UPI0009C13922|nr:translin-associated protein X isoform X2 [Amborella trichopoda]|eukprot:XP_020517988.1 translin-associated protein X isoform X2 [Amborella trichopoda]